jgi:hypothetical protein
MQQKAILRHFTADLLYKIQSAGDHTKADNQTKADGQTARQP